MMAARTAARLLGARRREGRPAGGGPRAAPAERSRAHYAVAAAGVSTWRGINVSRAMTRRWICEVPS